MPGNVNEGQFCVVRTQEVSGVMPRNIAEKIVRRKMVESFLCPWYEI
jgi:hypothetical protein